MKTPLELSEHGSSKLLRIVGRYTPSYVASYLRELQITFNPSHGPIDRRGEHLDILFICDLFREGVGSDVLQRQTLRWLVNVEGSSQI